jgi:hypothetical protein
MYAPHANQPSSRNVNMLERWFSMIGGGALTTLGLRSGGLRGLLLSLLGGYLAQRGLTGHCAVYEALGMNTSGAGASNHTVYNPVASAKQNEASNPLPAWPNQRDYGQQADQAEGERSPGRNPSTRVGPTPGSAEGDRATVEADLAAKQGSSSG